VGRPDRIAFEVRAMIALRKRWIIPVAPVLLASIAIGARAQRATAQESGPRMYGCPWNVDSLTNLEIGRFAGRMASYRFRAEHSGRVERILIYLIFRKRGYYEGDGGQILLELQTDDGPPQHHPSGTVLGRCLVTDPLTKWNRMFVLEHPVELEKGVLYHLVFSNPAPDPLANWTSIDCLHVRRNTPGEQPAISDTDLAVVFKPDARRPWADSHRATPIFCLFYNDGTRQGQGYVDSDSGTGGMPIAGPSRVRERFTVRGETLRVRSVSVRLRKRGSPGRLLVRLEEGDGRVVEEVTVPSSAIDDGDSWIECTFQKPWELLRGAT
jgi:hypothetical protein